jgi:hypothetical protein
MLSHTPTERQAGFACVAADFEIDDVAIAFSSIPVHVSLPARAGEIMLRTK